MRFSITIAALVVDIGYSQSKLIGKMMSRAANIHKILIKREQFDFKLRKKFQLSSSGNEISQKQTKFLIFKSYLKIPHIIFLDIL